MSEAGECARNSARTRSLLNCTVCFSFSLGTYISFIASEISINPSFQMLNHQKQFNFCINSLDCTAQAQCKWLHLFFPMNRYKQINKHTANSKDQSRVREAESDCKLRRVCVCECAIGFQNKAVVFLSTRVWAIVAITFPGNRLKFKWIEWECQALKISIPKFKWRMKKKYEEKKNEMEWRNNTIDSYNFHRN